MMDILETVLTLLVKGTVTGVGSKGGQLFVEKIKDLFTPNVAEKIKKAYSNAYKEFNKYVQKPELLIEESEKSEYFTQLIYGFNIIDGSDLELYQKGLNKLLLLELSKEKEVAFLIFNEKLDKIQEGILYIKDKLESKNLSIYPKNHFISKIDLNNFPSYYIPRKLKVSADWFTEITSFKELKQWVSQKDENKIIRAIILADGGIGKTTFLKYWANNVNDLGELYPVYISLRNCKSSDILQDYIQRRYPDLANLDFSEYEQLCFFLDGFDEIGDSGNATKQINDFVESHSKTNIIVSCRRNAYYDQLSEFKTFFISDITDQDIELFIKNVYKALNINTSHFFDEISYNNFRNLIYNPFYLEVLIKSYIKNEYSLNISKSELIDNLLLQRLEKDREHRPDIEINKPDIKNKINELGKKIAFVIALMEQRSISEKELVKLSGGNFDLTINSLPIKKGNIEKNIQYWDFEHNIFLEHLSSSVLKGLDFYKILEYTSNQESIKTKWRDIVTHLLGILEINNPEEKFLFDTLVSWLINHDAELLINIEKAQIDLNIRSKIFKKIYQWYQDKTIWFDNFIRCETLASFGETPENIEYVFNDIVNHQNHWRKRANAALLFQHFNLEFNHQKDILAKKYLNAIISIPVEEENLIHYLIYSYPFYNKECLDEIIQTFHNEKSQSIRSSVYHLIEKYNLQDLYIDVLLNGLKISITNNGSIGYETKIGIELALYKLKKSESYSKFFDLLADNSTLYYDWIGYEKGELKTIVKNCLNYYNTDILNSILNLFQKHYISYREIEPFFSLIENEKIRKDIFNSLLKNLSVEKDNHEYYSSLQILSFVLRDSDFEELYSLIHKKNFYISLYNSLEKDSVLSEKIKIHLIEKYDFQFSENINDVWEQRRKIEFEIYFNKEQFINECLNLFDTFGCEIINPKKLIKGNYGTEKYINLSILWFFNWFANKKEVSKTELMNWFDKNATYFEYYLNCQIFNKVHGMRDNVQLTEAQLMHIYNWYYKMVKEISFQVKFHKPSTFTMDINLPALIFYMEKFNLECSDEKLCELLNNPNADFNFITNRIKDKTLLVNKILENIQNFKEYNIGRVIKQCEYALDNKLTGISSLIIEILKSDFDSEHKLTLIDFWIENNYSIEPILSIYSTFNQSLLISFSQLLIKKNHKQEATLILYEILHNTDNENIKLSSINLLIWLKDLKALKLLIDISREKQTICLSDPFHGIRLGINMPDNYLLYDDIEALPLLMEFLELCYDEKYSLRKEFGNRRIENNLAHIALLSENNFGIVIETLQGFINSQQGKYKDVESLNFTIEKIKQQYRDKHHKKYSFKETKNICEEIFSMDF